MASKSITGPRPQVGKMEPNGWSSDVLSTDSPEAADTRKEEKMRTKFAILLAVASVCVTSVWADWTPEVLVTSGGSADRSLYPNNGKKVVFGPDGVGHLIWHGGGGIGCNRYGPVSGWTPDFQVSPTGDQPSIALDADGTTVHAIWAGATLCYRKCVRNEYGEDVWGDIVPLPQCGTLSPSMASAPGFDQSNHVVVCWYDQFTIGRRLRGEAIGFVECIGGVWGTPIRLDSVTGNIRRCPSVSVAPNGDVFIAYFANASAGGAHIFVKTRHDGVWGTTIDVTPGLGYDKCEFPAIEVNPSTGNPHVVFNWMRVTQISKKVTDTTSAAYHTYRNSQGVWQTPGPISVLRHGGDIGVLMHAPTTAFVGDGTAYAAWCEYSPTASHGNMYSYYSGEGGTWSTPAWLTSDTSASYADNSPHVAVDELAQTVHAVWDRLYPGMGWDTEIWSRNSPLGGGSEGGSAEPSAISQPGVELFPNPARAGRVAVQYSLPRAEPLMVTLLDVSGRTVRTQEVSVTDRSGSFSLDVSGLNAGVYVARLVTGDLTVSKSLVVQH